MLNIDIDQDANVFVMSLGHELGFSDVEKLKNKLDQYINETDRVPNLVFKVLKRPHWENFKTLKEHLRLVRDHHKLVKKVAVVSDGLMLNFLPGIIDHFVGAKVRHFSNDDLREAMDWAKAEDDHPGSFEILEGFPADVIAIEAKGTITMQDYHETLMPLVRDKLKEHDKLKLFVEIGEAFDAYSAGAVWDDTRFGLSHLTTFSKLALVSDIGWIRHSAKLFSPLIPTKVMVFHLSEIDQATHWIKT